MLRAIALRGTHRTGPVSVLTGIVLTSAFLVFAGCASTKKGVLQLQMETKPYSYSDAESRKLALKTFERLPELYEDYRIGPEDVLEISIFEWELREETKSVEVRVSENGLISLPVIGEMTVENHTVNEVQTKIEKRLKEWQIIPNPAVSVVVQQFRSKKVSVVGAVRDPGTYTLRRNVTPLLDILGLAGGVDSRAGQVAYVVLNTRPMEQAVVEATSQEAQAAKSATEAPSKEEIEEMIAGGEGHRPEGYPVHMPGRDVIAVDLFELMEQGDLSLNVLVVDGDVIYVPEAKRFHVVGFVRDPGSYSLKKPTSVLEAIALARGVRDPDASVKKCALKRITPEGEIIIPLNLIAISKGDAPNIYLQPDDIIDVRQTRARKVALYTYEFVQRVFNFGLSGRVF